MGGTEKALATPLFVCMHALLVKLWSCYMQGWHSCASARHRPFIFSLDAQVSTYASHYASTWTRMYVFTMD